MKLKTAISCALCTIFASLCFVLSVSAASEFSLSPMNQKIILEPGETYRGSITLTNPQSSDSDFHYEASVVPFYVDDSYDITFSNNGDYNKIVDWTTLERTSGTISPNTSVDLHFTIKVPKDAPAGGQYVSIHVGSADAEATSNTINIQSKSNIAHIIYAEISGTTKRSGDILSLDVPALIFSGNISGSATIKNTGNVHSTAEYTLQVFPLFSDEEVYTNEENPETSTILPERSLMQSIYWYETPKVGIYNVVYTVSYEGVTRQAKKLVIVCPLWLLFIIIAAVILAIFWLTSRAKKRKN